MNKTNALCRRLLTVLALVVAMVLPAQVWAGITPVKPSAGDGSSGNPYQIGNAAELYWFAALVNGTLTDGTAQNSNACAILTSNITVNTGVLKADGSLANKVSGFTSWTPISTDYDRRFGGTFDGKGHTVSGLYFNDASVRYVGLFGLSDRGTIKNVGVIASYFNGQRNVGGVCGHCYRYSKVTNCFSTSTVYGTTSVGGVCGDIYDNCTLSNSYNTGIVYGNNKVGGVCGGAQHSTISDCYNTGSVTGTASTGYVGGVCGLIGGSTSTMSNCYSTGNVISTSKYSGEINGYVDKSKVTNCYYLAASSNGSSGKTAAQFASGEVTWLLNGKQPTGTWGQLLGTDNLPMLDNTNKVYYGYQSCDESKGLGYYNTETQETRPAHSFNTNGFCNVCSGYQPATYVESSSQYEIANAGQLYWFAALVNGSLPDGTAQNLSANAVLKNDITVNTGVLEADGTLADDVSGFRSWTPMGTSSTKRYEGTFDGMGHTVSGLYYNNGNVHYVGLFGTSFNATIKNVGVVDSYLKGNTYVGGICGFCYVYNKGSVTNCFNSSTISGKEYVGGVCGYSLGNTFTHNYNTGQVSGTYREIGGLCGSIMGGSCENSYNTGSVTGINNRDQLGGVCGYMGNTRIENCYNTGAVSGAGSGPIYGELYNSTVTNSYYLASSDDDAGGKTAAQFAGGEVAWLLNGSQPTGTWGQLLGTDNLPVLDNTNKVLACALDATNATYWLTYSNLTADAALSVPADRELLVCNAQVKKGVLTLGERDDNLVAKGEGVLVKTDAPYLNAMPHTGSVLTPAAENDLVATPAEAQTIVADAGYTLYRLTYSNATTKEGLGFYLGVSGSSKDGSQLKATPGKAYLNVLTSEATAPASASPALAFRFADNDGETTSLRGISTTDGTMGAPAATYDLTGRKVSRPAHGLYIQNGKKVILK